MRAAGRRTATVVLAMCCWLVAGVVGAASLPPDDQYSPQQSTYKRDAARGPRRLPNWLEYHRDPYAELESPENEPGATSLRTGESSRERKSRKDSTTRDAELPFLGWNAAAGGMRNFTGPDLDVPEDHEEMGSPGSLENFFEDNDAFQDQGPGSVEVYKLDLHRENSLLVSPQTKRRQTTAASRLKSKNPKKARFEEIQWKLRPQVEPGEVNSLPAIFRRPPSVHLGETNPGESTRNVVDDEEVFAIGGVPELQVGCEGLEASERDRRSSGPGKDDGRSHEEKKEEDDWPKFKDPVYRESTEPILRRVTPIVLDFDDEPPSGRMYEELDELLKLKTRTTQAPESRRANRADIDPALENYGSEDDAADQTFPERGDLGTGGGKQAEVARSPRSATAEESTLTLSGDVTSQSHVGGRKLLWVQRPDDLEDPARPKRQVSGDRDSDLWGFGEDDGVKLSEDEDSEAENPRNLQMEERRREWERRKQEMERRRGGGDRRPDMRDQEERRRHGNRMQDPRRMEEMMRRRSNETISKEEEERLAELSRRREEEEVRRRELILREEEEERRRMELVRRAEAAEEAKRRELIAREEEEERRRVELVRREEEEEARRRELIRREEEEEKRLKDLNRRREAEEMATRTEMTRRREEEEARRRELIRREEEEERRRMELARRREEEERRVRLEAERNNEPPPSPLTRRPDNRTRSQQADTARREEEERKLREYMERNRPIDLKRMGDRRRPYNQTEKDDIRRHFESQRRRQMEEDRRRRQREEMERRMMDEQRRRQSPDEAERRRMMEEQRRRDRPDNDRAREEERRRQMEAQRRRDHPDDDRAREEQRRRQMEEEERKLQEYMRRNQPINAPRRNASRERSWDEQRRTLDEARQWEHNRDNMSRPKDGGRSHGPSAPTDVAQRRPQDVEDARRRQEATERREAERRRFLEEGRRREEQQRREESRRHEEERRRLEATRLREEAIRRRAEEQASRRSGSEPGEIRRPAPGRRTNDNSRRHQEDEWRRRSEERQRQQHEERERMRMERERGRVNNGRRRPQPGDIGLNRHRQRTRAEEEEWRKREEARLKALPVSASIVIHSDELPTRGAGTSPTAPPPPSSIGSRGGFGNEIDFPAINPNRRGLQAAQFPAPPTQKPPSKSPSACVWAIVNCCPANNRVATCFESMGCPGGSWDPSPCRPALQSSAQAEVLSFFESNQENQYTRH